jgi:hypothetical protein
MLHPYGPPRRITGIALAYLFPLVGVFQSVLQQKFFTQFVFLVCTPGVLSSQCLTKSTNYEGQFAVFFALRRTKITA